MVKEAVTDQYNIYFDKFRGGTIKASVFKRDLYITTDDSYHLQHVDIYPGWLMVNEGYLDSVIAQTPLEGLRLYKATVDDAFLPMGKYHCTVTCKQPGDSVINLHLLADSVHKPGELNLSTAHIRHLWFPPRDSANMAINLTLTRPIDIAYH